MAAGFALAEDALGSSSRHRAAGPRPINIGLVNNMPDAALVATEAQFQSLIARAAAGREVRLRLFSLPGVPRSAAAQAAMRLHLNRFPAGDPRRRPDHHRRRTPGGRSSR
jgi:homoserine trans-succinylase